MRLLAVTALNQLDPAKGGTVYGLTQLLATSKLLATPVSSTPCDGNSLSALTPAL
jgi:hypothetical protein